MYDDLVNTLRKTSCFDCDPCDHRNTCEAEGCFIQKAANAIEELQANVRPVVKAKWVWLSSTYDRTPCEMRYACSNCHHETITHNSDPWEKFCPNCGSDMREANDEKA